jgi:hypothetical protein
VHLLFRIRIRIRNLKLRIRIRILQKVSDPYGSGSTTLLLKYCSTDAYEEHQRNCKGKVPVIHVCIFIILDKSPQADSPDSTPIAGSRPVRAAVVNAAAISEAQADILSSLGRRTSKMRGRGKYKHLNEGDRLPRIFKSGAKKVRTGIQSILRILKIRYRYRNLP